MWFKGDHEPRHVHVFAKNDKLPGCVRLDTYAYLEGGQPPAAAIALIREFQQKSIV